MKIIHLAGEGSGVSAPAAPFLLTECCPLMRIEAFADRYSRQWSDVNVFIIDACLSTDGAPADQFAGITLLKLLRMKGLRQHAIVYSTFPMAALLKLGHHEILFSEGTSYEWLPGVITEQQCQERAGLVAEKDLSAFFLPEYNQLLRMERHSLANWWGVLQMREVLVALGMEGDIPFDEGLEEALQREDSYQGRLASYIRYRGEEKPQMRIDVPLMESMNKWIGKIRSRQLRVVFVDDKADEGWSAILQALLYGSEIDPEQSFFVPVVPKDTVDVHALCDDIVSYDPDLLILDLRLVQEDLKEKINSPSGLSLIRCLRESRFQPCFPILAFTASNKRTITEKALSLGADGVWTKEGMEESESQEINKIPEFSAQRAQLLVYELARLSGYEYTVLYGFMKRVRKLEKSPVKYWWEQTRWFPTDTVKRIPLERRILVRELRKIADSHRQILHANQVAIRQGSYDMLTVALCRILELFRSIAKENNEGKGSMGKFLYQWPVSSAAFELCGKLISARNRVVHEVPVGAAGVSDLQQYEKLVDAMMEFITMDTSTIIA